MASGSSSVRASVSLRVSDLYKGDEIPVEVLDTRIWREVQLLEPGSGSPNIAHPPEETSSAEDEFDPPSNVSPHLSIGPVSVASSFSNRQSTQISRSKQSKSVETTSVSSSWLRTPSNSTKTDPILDMETTSTRRGSRIAARLSSFAAKLSKLGIEWKLWLLFLFLAFIVTIWRVFLPELHCRPYKPCFRR